MTDIQRESLPLCQAPAEHVLTHARATFAQNSGAGFRLCFLFDASHHEDGLRVAHAHAGATGTTLHNLLTGLPEGDAPEVGFYLLAVDLEHADELFGYWAAPQRQPAGLWLWTTWDTPRLAAHLVQFIDIRFGKDQKGILRLADPFVWQALAVELHDPVGQHLVAPVGAYWQGDLDGQWWTVRPESRPDAPMPPVPLQLKPVVYAALDEAMWPAQIYHALYSERDEEPATGEREAALARIRDEYARARRWGGADALDFVTFSSLAEAFHTDFDSTPKVQELLEAAAQRKAKLTATLTSIPPEVWADVEQRRNTA